MTVELRFRGLPAERPGQARRVRPVPLRYPVAAVSAAVERLAPGLAAVALLAELQRGSKERLAGP
jgi:hypothetical protein